MTRRSAIALITCVAALLSLSFWQTITRAPRGSSPLGRVAMNSPNVLKAAERTSQEGVIDVRSFGAVGDGLTDDAAAIEAANAGVPPGGTLLFPPGTYCFRTPVTPKSQVTYKGIGATLKATNPDAIFKSPGLSYTVFDGFAMRSAYADANAIDIGSGHNYADTCAFRDLDIYCEFHTGVHAVMAMCLFDRCRFGYLGSPGTHWRPICCHPDSVNVASFNNLFRDCWFENGRGPVACVDFGYGNTQTFQSCVFELGTCAAVVATGVWGLQFNQCNFEAMRPGGTYNCLALLNQDDLGLSQGSCATFTGCRFTNNGNPKWSAVARCDPACWVGFIANEGAYSGYYALGPDDLYDRASAYNLVRFVIMDTPIGYSGTAATKYNAWGNFNNLSVENTLDAAVLRVRADTSTMWATKTVIKTVNIRSVASNDDYAFDNTRANTTEQVKILTNIVPAYADVLSWQVRCLESVTGGADVIIRLGTTSGGAEIGSGQCNTANAVLRPVGTTSPILSAPNMAKSLYLSGIPGADWNMLSTGRWAVIITYIDNGAACLQKAP